MEPDNNYKYFLYSEDQMNEKNQILERSGKEYVPGVVIVNGLRKKFTQLSSSPTLDRFIDTKVVAEGELNQFTYTKPSNKKKG